MVIEVCAPAYNHAMRRTFLIAAFLAAACSSSTPDSGKYTTHIESVGDDVYVIRVASIASMSEDALKKALLAEAARATIDRGRIYLRVVEVSAGSAIDVEGRAGVDPAQPPTTNEPAQRSSQISLSRKREGSIRFAIFREIPAGDRVYDASQLLDRLQRGETPE